MNEPYYKHLILVPRRQE